MVRSNRKTVQGLINSMVLETSNTNTPTVAKDNNKTTAASKLGKAKAVVVYENNNGNMKIAETELKSNNILGAHIIEEKEGWFYGWADNYDMWNNLSYTPTKENESGSSHTFTGDNRIFKLTKTKHNGRSKTRLVNEVPTSVKSDFYITSKINTGRLKSIIKPFDSGWSYILDLSFEFISLLVI